MLSPCLSRRHPAVPQYSVITYTDVGIRAMSNMMHHASCPTILCSLAATHTTPGAYATKPPCEAQAKASLNPVSVRGQLPAFTRAPRATQCMRSATRSVPPRTSPQPSGGPQIKQRARRVSVTHARIFHGISSPSGSKWLEAHTRTLVRTDVPAEPPGF